MSSVVIVSFHLSPGAARRLQELTGGATGDAAVEALERRLNPPEEEQEKPKRTRKKRL